MPLSLCQPISRVLPLKSHHPALLYREGSSLSPLLQLGVDWGAPGFLFPSQGCPALRTSQPLVGSHMAADQPTVEPKSLTASDSPEFSYCLPHSSSGGPWANDCTSRSLSFLISTPGVRMIQSSSRETSGLFPLVYPATLRGGASCHASRGGAADRRPTPPRWAMSNQVRGQGALWTVRDKRPCVCCWLLIYRPLHPPPILSPSPHPRPSRRSGPQGWEGAAPGTPPPLAPWRLGA